MSTWNEHLARAGATLADNTLAFASSADEAEAASSATIVVPLQQLGSIRVDGADAATFLHNLVSNDVSGMAADTVAWNSFNSPKGRMIASFLIWREGEALALATAADVVPAFARKLSMYVLRSKAKVSDHSAATVLLGVAGAQAAAVLEAAGIAVPAADMTQCGGDASEGGSVRCLRLNADTFMLVLPAQAAAATFDALVAAGAVKAGTAAWQLRMIRAGLPMIETATQEEFVAQMLNFDLIGGVSFRKGCYPGQEIVARTQYLGKLKKRLYRVALPAGSAPAVGADLYAASFGAQSAGKLVNVAPTADGGFEALAVLQSSVAEAETLHLGSVDGAPLQVLELPYALA